jgi:hypothetical protein
MGDELEPPVPDGQPQVERDRVGAELEGQWPAVR